jgi:hypothetical protein
MAHSRIENRIAKKFQPFIVQRLAFLVALADALVHQGLTVVLDVMGIEAQYFK